MWFFRQKNGHARAVSRFGACNASAFLVTCLAEGRVQAAKAAILIINGFPLGLWSPGPAKGDLLTSNSRLSN